MGTAADESKQARGRSLALPARTPARTQAILTLSKQALEHKTVPRWLVGARTDILMFSAACACLMHCYSGGYGEHRDIFASKYRNVLDFLFGGRGMSAGLIAHADSNRSLILKATAATR